MTTVKQHPYLVVFVLGWLLAVPAVFVRYPHYAIPIKILVGSIRGIFPMLLGWLTVYLAGGKSARTQLQLGIVAVSIASMLFFLLAVWAVTLGPDA